MKNDLIKILDKNNLGMTDKDVDNAINEILILFNVTQQSIIQTLIKRLQKLQRFDLSHYRDGEHGIDTEREKNDNGDYIDAHHIDLLIKDLTNNTF